MTTIAMEMKGTTQMSKEAMKLALGALEYHASQTRPIYQTDKAIAALKERLADPMREVQRLGQEIEQEPVCDKDPQGCWNVRCQLGKKCKNTPPQRKPLSFNEITAIEEKVYMRTTHKGKSEFDYANALIRATEAAHGIKEKNNV